MSQEDAEEDGVREAFDYFESFAAQAIAVYSDSDRRALIQPAYSAMVAMTQAAVERLQAGLTEHRLWEDYDDDRRAMLFRVDRLEIVDPHEEDIQDVLSLYLAFYIYGGAVSDEDEEIGLRPWTWLTTTYPELPDRQRELCRTMLLNGYEGDLDELVAAARDAVGDR